MEQERTTMDESSSCRVVLVGKTGNGKSSTGNKLLGKENFRTVQLPVNGVQMTVVDTPGLFDSEFDTQTGCNSIKGITRSLIFSLPGPHTFIIVIRCDSLFTEEEYSTFKKIQAFNMNMACQIMFDYTHQDQLGGTQDNDEKMYLRGLKPRITRQPETISQDERRRLLAVLCREATSNLPHSMQFSLHIGDKRIGDGSYRKAAGIDDGRSTLLAKSILYMSTQGLEDDIKLSVKLNLKGENKDYWTHSLTANGEVALPEKQRMYLSQPLRQLQSSGKCFPVSVHWVLETTEGSPQDLEAEVQLFDVTDNNSHDQVVASLSTENAA